MIYLITLVSILLFILNFKKDQRSLVNAFLFLMCLVTLYLSIVSITYKKSEILHAALLDILYKIIPMGLILFSILMIINGFIVIKKEGKGLVNLLPILMGIGILIYTVIFGLYFAIGYKYKHSYWKQVLITNSFAIITFIFVIFMFIFFSLLSYSIFYLYLPKKKDYDYIIIHGSGLIDGYKVPPLLAARIDKAIDAFYKAEKKNVKFIASGGKGSDEKLSEAEAIKNYLIYKNIEEERIIVENKSRTTFENLKFSKEIAQKEIKKPIYLFISNNYHIFRATVYAKRLKMKGYGLGAKTAGYYIPSAFIREYLAIIFRLKKFITFLLVFFLILILLSNL